MDEEHLETIIALLKNILLRQATPNSKDIRYWECNCGMENIALASDPQVCIICNRTKPLRIEGNK
jgi:hypothetical protein